MIAPTQSAFAADGEATLEEVIVTANKKEQSAKMAVTIEIRDLQQLTRIMDKIAQLRNVLDVSRGANGDTGLQ